MKLVKAWLIVPFVLFLFCSLVFTQVPGYCRPTKKGKPFSFTGPIQGQTLSNVITVALAGIPAGNYVKVYLPNAPVGGTCAFGQYDPSWHGGGSPFGSAPAGCAIYSGSFSYNTKLVRNGLSGFYAIAINSSNAVDGTAVVTFTVSNSGGPGTPTPTKTATPTPTPTPGGVQPIGNPPLPPGTSHWVLTYDVEFDQGTLGNINGGNGTPLGPPSWCHPGQQLMSTDPGFAGDLGFVGALNNILGTDCQEYYGTSGVAPYNNLINGALGLQIYPCTFTGTCSDSGPTAMYGESGAWVQTQNVFTQRFGYWEIGAKMPSDNAGEGDGYHTDIWLTVPTRQFTFVAGDPNESEFDISENVLGTNIAATHHTTTNMFDSGFTPYPLGTMPNADVGDLSAAFHAYGARWDPPGANGATGAQGAFTAYFDGAPQSGPYNVNSPAWAQGVYAYPGWVQQATGFLGGFFLNGVPVDGNTSINDPMYINYVRVWQAE